jgi:poly-gamma-glutamate capsule biosynthesis protein CapA/YwtB (metallophosphatase superfamily)
MEERMSVTVMAVGDVFPNDRFFHQGTPLSPEFAETLDVFGRADVRHATFLMPLSERGIPTHKVAVIRAHPEVMQDVDRLKLDVVSLANNHIFDFGPLAHDDTVDGFRGLGVQTIGSGRNLDEARTPLVVERHGLRIAFVAYSCTNAPGTTATASRPGVAGIGINSSLEINHVWAMEEPGEAETIRIHTWADPSDRAFAETQISALADACDHVIVSVHWGYGASEYLADYQRELGHAFADAGASAVVGHHVHAVQGIEVHGGVPILYSAGTFLGRQVPPDQQGELSELEERLIAAMSPDGYIAELTFGTEGLTFARVIPTTHDAVGLPHIARGDDYERTLRRLTRLSSRLGVDLIDSGDSLHIPLGQD